MTPLNLAKRKRYGRGEAGQCVCCGEKKKKRKIPDTSLKIALQAEGACSEVSASLNLDR